MQRNMAGNAKTSQATQSLCNANESEDYSDINNGLLYNLVPSRKLDSCTITFFTQKTYDEITKLLRAEYSFKPNANGSAFLANTEIGSSTVVLTLYKTKKLLIQGGGTWEWRNSVFRNLSNKLTPCNPESTRNASTRNTPMTELQIIFTVVSVFTKENFNPFSNLINPFGIGTHEIQWLFSIFLTHNWSPIYLLL